MNYRAQERRSGCVTGFSNNPLGLSVQVPRESLGIYGLNAGETEAIGLAQELGISELLIDDLEARQVAAGHGLTAIGTIAILEIASGFGWINFDEYIHRLRATSFRIRNSLIIDAKSRLKAKRLLLLEKD